MQGCTGPRWDSNQGSQKAEKETTDQPDQIDDT